MEFWGVDSSVLDQVDGATAVVSAAEMLETDYPVIAGAFGKYSMDLIDNAIVVFGENDEMIGAKRKIASHCSSLPIGSPKQLEDFAKTLVSKPNCSKDLKKLAYLAFSAISIHGPLEEKIISQINLVDMSMQDAPPGFVPGGFNQPPAGYVPSNDVPPPHLMKKSDDFGPKSKPEILCEIARDAFRDGAYSIALTAVMAAIKELEKAPKGY